MSPPNALRRAHRAVRLIALALGPLALAGCGPAIIAGAVILLTADSGGDSCDVPGKTVDVSFAGLIRYQERPVDPDAPDPGLEPVRGARVEVLRTNCGDDVIAETVTDDDGRYSVSFRTPSGSKLRVAAVSERPVEGSRVSVRNNDRERLLYSYESADVTLSEDPEQVRQVDVDIPSDCTYAVAGAFNLLEDARLGFRAMEGIFPAPERPLTILWELGDPEGTYFTVHEKDLDRDGRSRDPYIQIRGGIRAGGCHNTDHFDDALVVHEFGHFVAWLYSRDDSPGGPHAVGERIDARLAWSEGWADFYSAISRDSPLIFDTFESVGSCAWPCESYEMSLESKGESCGGSCCEGISSEEAVGSFLWQLHDPIGPEVFDEAQVPRADILGAVAALKDPAREHRFVYVGDFLDEILLDQPGQREAILVLARREGLADADDQVAPFPEPFPVETRAGDSLHAEAEGAVNGCDIQDCKVFAENFELSSRFYELVLPGSPPTGGTLTARIAITPLPFGCSNDLQLKIFDQDQALFYSTEGQPGFEKSLRIPLKGSFSRGTAILVQVAGNTPVPEGSSRGQKGLFSVTIDVQ